MYKLRLKIFLAAIAAVACLFSSVSLEALSSVPHPAETEQSQTLRLNAHQGRSWQVHLEPTLSNVSTSLHPLIQVSSKTCGASTNYETPFEDYWYANGKAVGMFPHEYLRIPPGEEVSILLIPQRGGRVTLDENRAAAGAIQRIVLRLILNRNHVSSVVLPDSCYWGVAAELQSRRGVLLPVGSSPPPSARVSFDVESATSHIKQTIYFN